MVSMNNIKPAITIKKAAEALKTTIKEPEWAKFVKTGHGKVKVPEQSDWYFTRTASILRKIYINGPIGTQKLRKVYSTKKNRGHAPEKTTLASGKIIRSALQQLETAGLIQQTTKGVRKGRVVTPKGKGFLDKLGK